MSALARDGVGVELMVGTTLPTPLPTRVSCIGVGLGLVRGYLLIVTTSVTEPRLDAPVIGGVRRVWTEVASVICAHVQLRSCSILLWTVWPAVVTSRDELTKYRHCVLSAKSVTKDTATRAAAKAASTREKPSHGLLDRRLLSLIEVGSYRIYSKHGKPQQSMYHLAS